MRRPETSTKSPPPKTKNVNDYFWMIFIFFFLFPKFSTIIIYYFCERQKINAFKRGTQTQETGV